ncbi:hypothetical protein [Bacillus thuringiensis]|uniref:hypothetical protein n=1 Tax=Bacillus thuringiensis TaxID=1428 RepID=UPI000BFC2E72|nr:hypothetical protein [Bacillus thuringiensis]PGT89884.1 hypothetical protein COD17_09035 [Bacillus thuringiensis]
MLSNMKYKAFSILLFLFAFFCLLDGLLSVAGILVILGIGLWVWGNVKLNYARDERSIKRDARRDAKYNKVYEEEYHKQRRK